MGVFFFESHRHRLLIKLVYESPVAKKRRVIANPLLTGIASLKCMLCLEIFGQILLINNSKLLGDILTKVLKLTQVLAA